MGRRITSQRLTMLRSKIAARKARLAHILKEAREIRAEIAELEERYEIEENIFIFGEGGGSDEV